MGVDKIEALKGILEHYRLLTIMICVQQDVDSYKSTIV